MSNILWFVALITVAILSAIERRFLVKLIKAERISEVVKNKSPTPFRSAHQNAIDNQHRKGETE